MSFLLLQLLLYLLLLLVLKILLLCVVVLALGSKIALVWVRVVGRDRKRVD